MHVVEQSEDARYWQTAVAKAVDAYRINHLLQRLILMRFSANQRLRKAKDFQQVRESGFRINCGSFIAILRKNALGVNRFGVIASSKVGNAVKRNRAKRIFREIFRLNQQHLGESIDIVIIVRYNFEDYGFKDLTARFLRLCESYKNHIYKNDV